KRIQGQQELPHAQLEQELPAPFAQLNSATLTDGVHLTVADNANTKIETLFIGQHDQASYCNTRLHVDLGANSKLTLLESYQGQGPVLTNGVTNIVGEDNSELVHYRMQAEQAESAHIGSVLLIPGAASDFRSYQLMHGTALRRNDVRTLIEHSNVSVNMKGVFIGADSTHTDN